MVEEGNKKGRWLPVAGQTILRGNKPEPKKGIKQKNGAGNPRNAAEGQGPREGESIIQRKKAKFGQRWGNRVGRGLKKGRLPKAEEARQGGGGKKRKRKISKKRKSIRRPPGGSEKVWPSGRRPKTERGMMEIAERKLSKGRWNWESDRKRRRSLEKKKRQTEGRGVGSKIKHEKKKKRELKIIPKGKTVKPKLVV